MVAEINSLKRQLDACSTVMNQQATGQVALKAEAAFKAGNIDERSYVDLVSTRLAKEQVVVTIEQSLLDQRVAIATLVGSGNTPIITPPSEMRRHDVSLCCLVMAVSLGDQHTCASALWPTHSSVAVQTPATAPRDSLVPDVLTVYGHGAAGARWRHDARAFSRKAALSPLP